MWPLNKCQLIETTFSVVAVMQIKFNSTADPSNMLNSLSNEIQKIIKSIRKVGAMSIAILGGLIKPRLQVGDCGRQIQISVCSPSLHDKTSKPQIQSLGNRALKEI